MSGKKLYAYGNGSFGCLFDHTEGPFDTQQEAADAASELFELLDKGRTTLARDGYLNLHEYRHHYADVDEENRGGGGADVIEIFEVDEHWSADGSSVEAEDVDG